MKLIVDQGTEVSINVSEFNLKWMECTKGIYEADRLIYSVDIDGNLMYADFEEYIYNNIKEIQVVHISTLSRLESIEETEESLREYLKKYIPITSSIADQMYGELSSEVWEDFSVCIKGLQWIVSSLQFLRYLYKGDLVKVDHLSKYCKELEKIIAEIEGNLNKGDLVNVGDLFHYELLPHLVKFQ